MSKLKDTETMADMYLRYIKGLIIWYNIHLFEVSEKKKKEKPRGEKDVFQNFP